MTFGGVRLQGLNAALNYKSSFCAFLHQGLVVSGCFQRISFGEKKHLLLYQEETKRQEGFEWLMYHAEMRNFLL